MNAYNNRNQLKQDIDFIYQTLTGVNNNYRNQLITMLFNEWINHSDDSPLNYIANYNDESMNDAAETLVKISKETGISNQWKGEHTVFEDVPRSKHYNLRKL